MWWMFDIVSSFMQGFFSDPASGNTHPGREQELRRQLDEKQIDKMIESSFPASDPPSTY